MSNVKPPVLRFSSVSTQCALSPITIDEDIVIKIIKPI